MNRKKKFPFQCVINQQRKQHEKQEKINGISDLKYPYNRGLIRCNIKNRSQDNPILIYIDVKVLMSM